MFKWIRQRRKRHNNVSAGARLLDEREPGWEHKVNLATLDVSNSQRCVLGQLGRNKGYYLDGYLEMVESLGIHTTASGTIDHGFAAPWKAHGLEEEYEELTRLWRKEVLERLPV